MTHKTFLTFAIMLLLSVVAEAKIPDIKFRRLDTRHGLSNSQVNCILQDSRGYVWVSTPFGLCRYDGYRFRNFYSYERDTTTLKSNRVDNIQEAYDGKLWLDHGMAYSVYDPVTEKVDRTPAVWLARQGISGGIEKLYIDSRKNFWIKTYDNGFFFFNPQKKFVKKMNFGYGMQEFPREFGITSFCETAQGMAMTSNMGQLICVDGERGTVVWTDDTVNKALNTYNDYWVYIDKDNVKWVITHSTSTYIYEPREQRWYTSLTELMRAKGFENVPDDIVVWEVRYDNKGYLWVASDHLGVLVLDFKNKEWKQLINQKGDETSLPDITAKHLYQDDLGRMWVSTYKNGVAMSADAMANFRTLPYGDINTICEDKAGFYWLGLNSGGIRKVDPTTLEIVAEYDKHALGLTNAVMVGSYAAKDGTLWFGTWEDGLLRYRDGQWKNYRMGDPGCALTSNNVWAVTEDYWGNIWAAVLGGGVLRIDGKTGAQREFNDANSNLRTNWTNSITRAANGWMLLGNSEYAAVVHPKTMKIINLDIPHDENSYTISAATTQAIWDKRGLVWQGSASGLTVSDRKTGRCRLLDMTAGFYGSSVSALQEDDRHTVWVVTDHGISNVIPQKREDGNWSFVIRSFNEHDGLQPGPFNQRSICYTSTGRILVGGQDGLDIIDTKSLEDKSVKEKPLFSGLQIFDQDVAVGQEVDGRIILDEALDVCRELSLRFNDQFTIQLASNSGIIANGKRFVYRLDGFNENWVKTSELNPNITYNSLRAGSYVLHVRMLNEDGTFGAEESLLKITIRPPLWRTRWMILLYMLLIAAAAWWWRKWFLRRQEQRMQVETLRRETEKMQWMSEMRMQLAAEKTAAAMSAAAPFDDGQRSAPFQLQLHEDDLVTVVKRACRDFSVTPEGLKGKVTCRSMVDELMAQIDRQQLAEALTILLSNSVKFSPGNCQISVNVGRGDQHKAIIQIADNGIGIRDEYKEHAFDPMVGSEGIGLDKVKDIVVAHGGTIRLEDNPGGGTVFIISLPAEPEVEEAEVEEVRGEW